jgi:tetratricopeptide (TPR) repeat protein
LNPRCIQARGWYALFYLQFFEQRLAEGVAQAMLALESDPLSSYAHTIYSFTCAFAGRHAEAVQASRRAVELDSESYLARAILQGVLHLSRQFEESVAVGELALAMSGRHCWSMAVLAVTFADWGKPADAEAVYAEMLARSRRCYVQPSSLAIMAAALNIDEAICHAREAFEIRDPMAPVWFSKIWPASARLRADPRFPEIAVDTGWLLK